MTRPLTFIIASIKNMVAPPVSFPLLAKQMEFVGNRSFGIIILSGGIMGAVFGLQMGEFLLLFGGENMIGATTAFAVARELAPVFGSFLVTARSGSAMASEIGAMRINEQIDALQVMAINPIGYLVSPRILASILMMPFLTAMFMVSSVAACFFVGVAVFDVDVGIFFDSIPRLVDALDVRQGLEKSLVFGAIFSTVGCYKGFYTKGGAEGVGRSTSQAVVVSLVLILVLDFFISYLQYRIAPPTIG